MKEVVGLASLTFGITGFVLSGVNLTGAVIGSSSMSILSAFYLPFILVGALILLSECHKEINVQQSICVECSTPKSFYTSLDDYSHDKQK